MNIISRSLVFLGALIVAACAPGGNSPTDSQSGCSLANVNFEKYGSISSGMTIDEVNTIIGCSNTIHEISAPNTTARWYLANTNQQVFIQAIFHETTGLFDQSIDGIDSGSGQPKCSHAPAWPNCFGSP